MLKALLTKPSIFPTFAILLGTSIVALAPASLSAAPISFNAAGTLTDGSILSGIVTVDTVAGLFTSANLILIGASSFTFTNIVSQGDSAAPFFYSVGVRNATATEDFNFGLQLHSLVGYSGGAICSTATPSCAPSSIFNLVSNSGGPSLASGTLTTTATPEPSALWLTAIALVSLVVLRRSPITRFA